MRKNRYLQEKAVVVLLVILLACMPAIGAETGKVSVSVYESGTEKPLSCRAWVSIGKKHFFNPLTESCTSYARDRSFSCNGEFVIDQYAAAYFPKELDDDEWQKALFLRELTENQQQEAFELGKTLAARISEGKARAFDPSMDLEGGLE